MLDAQSVAWLDAAARSRECASAAVQRAHEQSRGHASAISESEPGRRRAYVTLLTTESYSKGVIALRRSLAELDSAYPLIVMAGSSVSAATLAQLADIGCEIRHVSAYALPPGVAGPPQYACAHFADCWMKLHMWDWDDEFAALVYLDADMILLRPIDHLLDHCELLLGPAAPRLPGCDPRAEPLAASGGAPAAAPPAHGYSWIAAVQECVCPVLERRHLCPYPTGPATAEEGAATPLEASVTGGSVAAQQAATSATQPLQCKVEADHSQHADYFNAGLLVLRPDRALARHMAQALARCDLSRFPFAEQDFLNLLFRGRWLPLKWEYNASKALFGAHRESVWDYAAARVLHYTMAKPWDLRHPCHRGFHKLNTLWLAAFSEPQSISRVLFKLHMEDKRRRRDEAAAGRSHGDGVSGDHSGA